MDRCVASLELPDGKSSLSRCFQTRYNLSRILYAYSVASRRFVSFQLSGIVDKAKMLMISIQVNRWLMSA